MLRESYLNTALKHDHNLKLLRRSKNDSIEPCNNSTLLGFRHGIERYLNSAPYNKGLQIANDPRFLRVKQDFFFIIIIIYLFITILNSTIQYVQYYTIYHLRLITYSIYDIYLIFLTISLFSLFFFFFA